MGARGTKPKDNMGSKLGVLSPLDVEPPDCLQGGPAADGEYRRLAAELVKLGHLSAVNRQCLVNYCEAYELASMALKEINDEGVTLESMTGGKYMHPACAVWSMARGVMEKEAKNLGMTPMSLQSMKNVKSTKKEDSAPEGSKPSHYLGRKKG